MSKEEFIFEICLVFIQHLKVCIEYGSGWNTDIFMHLLNKKEENLISLGISELVNNNTETHLEHVVPRLVLLQETRRLIEEKSLKNTEIAHLLQKHWKVARISKDEQQKLDLKSKLNLKQTMPEGWTFENGDTLARFKKADIVLRC
jgi:hypothetical protein